MLETTVLTLTDGARIVVPDSLDLITPYVLREQQDFFEDELPFVRSLLGAGQTVIDIGANYGVYTLPMAQRVGPSGHVWAFEPALSTARFLAQSIAVNGFTNVTLEQKAVSSAAGSAQLTANFHSELRSIVRDAAPPGGGEMVSLVTLDDCMDSYHWVDIDLIKIDAEGEESNILEGGRRFFGNLAPLVQYELRKGADEMNLDLIRDFAAIGYDSYRLVPGLNLLVPFDGKTPPDSYLLNLFCCKAARANRLAERGFLLRQGELAGVGKPLSAPASPNEGEARYHWRYALAHMPYAAPLTSVWEMAEEAGESVEVLRALGFYARSRDTALSMADRFQALEASILRLRALCAREPSRLRLASLARVAHDYGARAESVNALVQLIESIGRASTVDPSEPFLAPLERFDSIAPGDALGSWILGAALEQLERRESFSTFYVGPSARNRLEAIHALGFGGPDMQRRLELVHLRIDRARAAKGEPRSPSSSV